MTATPRSGSTPARPALRAVDRIRAAARDLFYRRGIRAVGVEEIVATAGVTKPSLYRAFTSKDELAAAYLRDYEGEFWVRFDAAVAAHPGDARAQVMAFLRGIAGRATQASYRGCGLTNAVVEYPDPGHPAFRVSLAHKQELRRRLRALAAAMGAAEPGVLGDGLHLLIEGAYVSGQLFGPGGPAGSIAEAAERMIAGALKSVAQL